MTLEILGWHTAHASKRIGTLAVGEVDHTAVVQPFSGGTSLAC